MSRLHRLLLCTVLLAGCVLSLAFLAILLPVSVMQSANDWLRLDTFPDAPLTVYLARSTSLLYGIHGVVMIYTPETLEEADITIGLLVDAYNFVVGASLEPDDIV